MKKNYGQFIYALSFCVSAPSILKKKDGIIKSSNIIVDSFGPCVNYCSLKHHKDKPEHDLIIGGLASDSGLLSGIEKRLVFPWRKKP
jgi:hypothetical protein